MQTTDTAALLQTAPEEHSRRCALAKSALDSERWPAAACGLRHAAARAEEWAERARQLAHWCDTQGHHPQRLQAVADHPLLTANRPEPAPAPLSAPLTVEALEAGLMALAHHLGRDHANQVRRAIAGVLLTSQQGPTCTTPAVSPALHAEARLVGFLHDSASLEPADVT